MCAGCGLCSAVVLQPLLLLLALVHRALGRAKADSELPGSALLASLAFARPLCHACSCCCCCCCCFCCHLRLLLPPLLLVLVLMRRVLPLLPRLCYRR